MFECRRGPWSAGGFTLIEVLIATTLLVSIAIGVGQLMMIGVRAGWAARAQTAAAVLAAAKIEQLRSLPWTYEPIPGVIVPRTDYAANLNVDPPSDGGPGLAPSPPGTLAANRPPYVDYLDAEGRWVGNGPSPPPGAVFVRRWAIAPLQADPFRTVVFSVLVTTVAHDESRAGPWTAPGPNEALLVLLRTRSGT